MLVLFCRVIILYFLVFFVIRLTGKRQISELQPFDLCITLLIADMASVPVRHSADCYAVFGAAAYIVPFS